MNSPTCSPLVRTTRTYAPQRLTCALALCLGLVALLGGCVSAATQAQRDEMALRKETSQEALIAKGEAAASLGDTTRAEQYFAAALAAAGSERRVLEHLLLVCVSDQRYPVAAQYAERYLQRHPRDADMRYAAASLQLAIGNTARARQLLEALVGQRPEWPEPHFALASILRETGELPDVADQHDRQYLKLDPHGPLAERAEARLGRKVP